MREKENQALRESFQGGGGEKEQKSEKRVPAVGQREATRAEKKRGAFVSLSLAPRWLRLRPFFCARRRALSRRPGPVPALFPHRGSISRCAAPLLRQGKRNQGPAAAGEGAEAFVHQDTCRGKKHKDDAARKNSRRHPNRPKLPLTRARRRDGREEGQGEHDETHAVSWRNWGIGSGGALRGRFRVSVDFRVGRPAEAEEEKISNRMGGFLFFFFFPQVAAGAPSVVPLQCQPAPLASWWV